MKKATHGGARPGAGRPSLVGPTRTLTLRIPSGDLEKLEKAGIANLSRFYVDAGNKAIKKMLKRSK